MNTIYSNLETLWADRQRMFDDFDKFNACEYNEHAQEIEEKNTKSIKNDVKLTSISLGLNYSEISGLVNFIMGMSKIKDLVPNYDSCTVEHKEYILKVISILTYGDNPIGYLDLDLENNILTW